MTILNTLRILYDFERTKVIRINKVRTVVGVVEALVKAVRMRDEQRV